MPENLETNVITNDIKNVSTPNPCEDIGNKKILTPQQIIQIRYYLKHRDKIKYKAKLVRDNEKLTRWKKLCPTCNREMFYTNKNNLQESIKRKLQCKSCKHKEAPYQFLYNYLIYISRRRKIDCTLTFNDFLSFTTFKNCVYCNEPLIWPNHNTNQKPRPKCRYNLDRIVNSIGYTKENCCVCCPTCNNIKSNRFTYDEMIEIGKTIRRLKEKKYNEFN